LVGIRQRFPGEFRLIAINVARELREWWSDGCRAGHCALAPVVAPRYISGEFP
jgi:hypothetical protein